MGTVYRRQVRFCTACDRRLDTTAARIACMAASHAVELRDQGPWWIKYQVRGRPVCVSSGTERKEDAKKLLRQREHLVDSGAPVTAHQNRVTFEDAAADLVNDYTVNKRRSLRTANLRISKHLTPYFAHRRLMTITVVDARAYTGHRLREGASNASVNRDLMLLKRMCTLAMQAGKLMVRPYIPLLKEHNVRTGFFEPQQSASVQRHLPTHMRGIAAFAFVTGWRTPSEILPLEWRQVDLKQNEVRLDVGATKNGEGRVFPITIELRRILESQQEIAKVVKREHGTIPRHVFCYTKGAKAGNSVTEGGYNKAWRKARVAAGCPGRIPPRLSSHRGAQSGAGRGAGARRDADDRTQDSSGVRALQHCQPWTSSRRRATT
ncbi:MAG: phage integrase protein breaking and rejoining enzyme [Acidobacteria bacterium]|nr:phage integrase protein breaking and rejoining enzyme [Acidobacteriota bacterium]